MTSSGELTTDERLELESLRELWRTMKPFLLHFSISVLFSKLDPEQSRKSMMQALDYYEPMADASINYSQKYGVRRNEPQTIKEAA